MTDDPAVQFIVSDHYDLQEGRDVPSRLRVYLDRDEDLVIEWLEDDCIYLEPDSARALAAVLQALAKEVEAKRQAALW